MDGFEVESTPSWWKVHGMRPKTRAWRLEAALATRTRVRRRLRHVDKCSAQFEKAALRGVHSNTIEMASPAAAAPAAAPRRHLRRCKCNGRGGRAWAGVCGWATAARSRSTPLCGG